MTIPQVFLYWPVVVGGIGGVLAASILIHSTNPSAKTPTRGFFVAIGTLTLLAACMHLFVLCYAYLSLAFFSDQCVIWVSDGDGGYCADTEWWDGLGWLLLAVSSVVLFWCALAEIAQAVYCYRAANALSVTLPTHEGDVFAAAATPRTSEGIAVTGVPVAVATPVPPTPARSSFAATTSLGEEDEGEPAEPSSPPPYFQANLQRVSSKI